MGDVGLGLGTFYLYHLTLITNDQQPMTFAARPVDADDGGIAIGHCGHQIGHHRASVAAEFFEADLVAKAVD
ncbi:hypothetical protein D3C76_1666680 [compost metagenome]